METPDARKARALTRVEELAGELGQALAILKASDQ
jgi:hypothetical protein